MTTHLLQAATDATGFDMTASPQLGLWLEAQNLSLALTTYQTNRLFFVGSRDNGELKLHECLFDKPMELYAEREKLYLSTRYQLWQFDNLLAPGELRNDSERSEARERIKT